MLRKMIAVGCALVLAGWAAAGPDYVAPTLPMPSGFSTKSMTEPAVRPGVMHLFVAALEEPEKFEPTLHVAFEEKLPWLKLADGLPTRIGPDYTKT